MKITPSHSACYSTKIKQIILIRVLKSNLIEIFINLYYKKLYFLYFQRKSLILMDF